MLRLVLFAAFFDVASIAYSQENTNGLDHTTKNLFLKKLSAIEETSGGKLGVSVIHIESGKKFSKNGSELFPAASTFKVAVALKLLSLVDSKSLSLDSMITIRKADLHPGSEITDIFRWPNGYEPGLALSVHSLLEYMLLISDNSASDLCLSFSGGAQAVTNKLKSIGIDGMLVRGSTLESNMKSEGIVLPPNKVPTMDLLDSLSNLLSPQQKEEAKLSWVNDAPNKTTPEAMSLLLQKIQSGKVLSPKSNALLLDIMTRCLTGKGRIKGLLPEGTVVAHKTGSQVMTVNDAGIITLPGGKGRLVISVFITKSPKDPVVMEEAIAKTAKLFYDYFTSNVIN